MIILSGGFLYFIMKYSLARSKSRSHDGYRSNIAITKGFFNENKSTCIRFSVIDSDLSACSGKDVSATDVAVAVALTQTAAAPVEPQAETLPTAETVEQPPASEAVRIELAPGQTSWYTNGDLNAGSAQYVLSGQAGQQVTFWLTPDPAQDSAALNIHSADGTLQSTSPETYWSSVLPATQDYFIDILNLSNGRCHIPARAGSFASGH